MSERLPTIGLEIHVGLKTQTKMFCDCPNNPGDPNPNTNVCPVCLGHPGALPTANKQAIEHVIRVGLALGGTIADITKFDRKNYFYPDLPKGYQISQYDQPLVTAGSLNSIRLRRIHLEEDVGRSLHGTDTFAKGGETLIDYNRSSIPLMELVTEPDIRSADEAVAFARELQLILRYLGVSDADMEKGLMRIEANVSLNMGTKTELKNINSFRAVHDAVAYELVRQAAALDAGERIVQETRGWDEVRRVTVSQRIKEDAHDYRYFPEPDLPPFETAAFGVEAMRAALPELPEAKRVRFAAEYGLSATHVDILITDPVVAEYFEEAVSELRERVPEAAPTLIYNYLTSDMRGILNDLGRSFDPEHTPPRYLGALVAEIERGALTSRQAKDVLRIVIETGTDPETVIAEHGFGIVSDEVALEATASAVIQEHPAAVADYHKGKHTSLQFLVGKAMAALKGQADPNQLRVAIERELTKSV